MSHVFFENPNKQLLTTALTYFQAPGTTEAELLFRTTDSMLRKLDSNRSDFLEQFDKIVFGTMVMAIAIEENKYGRGKQFSAVNAILDLQNEEKTTSAILANGERLKTKEVTLTAEQVELYFPEFIRHAPMIKDRLNKLTEATMASTAPLKTKEDDAPGFRLCCTIS